MTNSAKRRGIIVFVIAVLVQAIGFPLISRALGLGERFQAPSWVVIVLVSGLMAAIAAGATREKTL